LENISLLTLGHCNSPHGIKGGFSCRLYNVEESSLEFIKEIYLYPKSDNSSLKAEGELFHVRSVRMASKIVLFLKGVNDRNHAEELIPFEIRVNRNDLPNLEEEGEYYLADLIGLEVREFSSGEKIGIVSKFYDNGAQPVLVIEGDDTFLELPFVEAFFKEVDLDKRLIRAIRPEVISERD